VNIDVSPSVGEFVGQAADLATWRQENQASYRDSAECALHHDAAQEEERRRRSRSPHHGCLFPLEKMSAFTAVSITDETCGGHIRKFEFRPRQSKVDLQELKIPRNINLKIV
jgi:hypothetical protein